MEELHDRAAFIAPSLLAFEIGNVVHAKKPAVFGRTPPDRVDLVRTLLSDVSLVETDDAARARAGPLAEEERLSFYDACYLDLAASRRAALLTEDERLAKAAARRLPKGRVLRLP